MSRNELLERILAARYELDYSSRETKANCEAALWALVDKAIQNTNISRHELLHTIHDRYIEFKREKRKQERVSGANKLRG